MHRVLLPPLLKPPVVEELWCTRLNVSSNLARVNTESEKNFSVGDSLYSGVLERLKSDTQLAILTMFGVVGSLAIGPFVVYRWMQGDTAEALLDALIVATMLGSVAYAWKTGRSAFSGNIVSILLAAGALALILASGFSYLWLFSLMIAIFLMASSRVSIALSLLFVVAVGSSGEVFNDAVERFTFLAVAIQVAVFSFVFAWRTSHQHRQLDAMANHDPLTGAGNRRALRREINARIKAARNTGECAAVALIDLDHFKQINDRDGHDAGDKVLVDLAEIAKDTMRACDGFYRYGGEEFVLVMPDTPPPGIEPALEKLQAAIRERLRGPGGSVTVSIGAAGLNPTDDPVAWLSRADRALYAAKSAGRNRLCIGTD